jgi:uncharacterized membrane protein YgdD (TMEM256/DUF423 family)
MDEQYNDSSLNIAIKARFAMIFGALYLCLGIIVGAFAAHALKGSLNDYQLSIMQTGVKYQLVHGVALLIIGVLLLFSQQVAGLKVALLHASSIALVFGIFCFSFSLYAIAIFDASMFGIITPIGGMAMIIAWLLFVLGVYRAGK